MKFENDLANYAIKYGENKGADYIEARYVESNEENYVTRNGMFVSIQGKEKKGLGIRLIHNGGMSFGSIESLTKPFIEKTVDTLIKIAGLSKRKNPITFSEEPIVDTYWEAPVKKPFVDISQDEKRKYIKNIDKMLKKDVKGKLPSRLFIFMLYDDKKYFVTNEGTKISSQNSLPAVYTMTTAKGKKGTEQRMFGKGGSGGWEWFNDVKFGDLLLDDCQRLVNTAEKAKNFRFDHPIDVLISGEVAGIMAHENVGHPSEADRIMGREGAQAGESFYAELLKENKLGEAKIGNEEVTIIEDPTMPGSAGFYLYDDEGVKARPRYLIKEGKLNELLLNREFAAKMNTNSNAAARAISFDREPISRMANTYFAPGDFKSVDELAEDIKSGMYMRSFTEWNIDDRRFQSKYVGLEAYVIENGKITDQMIRRPVLELTTYGILGSVDGVTQHSEYEYGTCGKSDPMQGVPVSMGGAEVRMRNIKIGGNQ